MIAHLPTCAHYAHGAACGLETAGRTSCLFCQKIVDAQRQGRDDMLAILASDPNPTVALAAQDAASLCVYAVPTLEEM